MGDQVMQPFEMNSADTMVALSAANGGNKGTRHICIPDPVNPNSHLKFSTYAMR